MTRALFDRELEELEARLLRMASEVEENIVRATQSLTGRDLAAARNLIAADEHINEQHIQLETDCLIVIATQQPLASDLRRIASTIAIASELERIHDYAKGIAKISLMIGEEPLLPAVDPLPEMAARASSMLNRALRAFVERDTDAAYAVHASDDEVDNLYNAVYDQVLSLTQADPTNAEQASHLLWAAHNLERTADRVSNICERVIFTVTGTMIEMPEEFETPSNEN